MSESSRVAGQSRVVTFIVTNYPPRTGGVEAHVRGLAQELARRGHTIIVITLDSVVGDTTENGVRVTRLPRHADIGGVIAFPSLHSVRRIRAMLRAIAPDVISTHTRFFPMSYLAVRLGRSLGIPIIHTEHGSNFVSGVSPLVAMASRVVDLTLGRATLRRATRVVGVSRGVVDFVRRLAGVEANVFPNAIDVDQWRQASRRSAPASPRRVVFVGRIVPGKGWDIALSASELLAREHPDLDFTLHICGDGPQLDALSERAASSPLASRVVVHGRLDMPELAQLLSGSVLLNPTTLSEGFQTTLIEAIASGASLITTPVPGVPELAERRAPMTVVDQCDAESFAHALRHVLGAPPVRSSGDDIDYWSWNARARQYEQLIDSVDPTDSPEDASAR